MGESPQVARAAADEHRVLTDIEQAVHDAVRDPERLAVLASGALEAMVGDPGLDAIARQAANLCRTPLGLVTVLDANRQWNVGRSGTTLEAVPVGMSLCAHVVADGAVVVGDLRFDDRFRDNPLVAAEAGLRFYAGMPIRLFGLVVGAVAVADVRPRALGPTARSRLTELTLQAGSLLALRLTDSSRGP